MLFQHLSGGKTGCTGRFSGGVPHWDFCKEPHLPTLALTALLNLLPSEKLTPGLPRAPGLHIARLCGAKVLGLESF